MLNGRQSLLVRHEGELVDALRHGQGVLSVVPLGELDGAITRLGQPGPGRAPVAERETD